VAIPVVRVWLFSIRCIFTPSGLIYTPGAIDELPDDRIPWHKKIVGQHGTRGFFPMTLAMICPPQLASVRFKDSEDTPIKGLEYINGTRMDEDQIGSPSSAADFVITAR
jgi:hypothetical protein